MRIMYMGTPAFALPCLEAIASKHEVVCVVTQPDKPKGRGHKMLPPPVKEMAVSMGIDVLQPLSLKDGSFMSALEKYQPDAIVVVAYGRILPEYILEYPKYGCINLHASLLPKYRGAAPIQRAVVNGETESGVCTMKMEKGLDTGDVYEVARTEIGEHETAGELHDRLMAIGADLMVSTLSKIDKITATPQEDALATYAAMITKETARIDWTKSAREIVNLIRGMNPSPVAYTVYKGEPIKVLRAVVGNAGGNAKGNASGNAGQIIDGKYVAAGDGIVVLQEIRPAGGKNMSIEDYLRGHTLEGYMD